jgi:hypothetical protein
VEFLPSDEFTDLSIPTSLTKNRMNFPTLDEETATFKLRSLIYSTHDPFNFNKEGLERGHPRILKTDYSAEIKERAKFMINACYDIKIIATRLNLKTSQVAWIKRKMK